MRRKTCLFNLGHFLFLLLPLCGFNGQGSVCYVFVTLPTVPLNYYKVLDLLNRKAQVNNFVFLESKLLLPIFEGGQNKWASICIQSLQPCISFQSWFGDNYVLLLQRNFQMKFLLKCLCFICILFYILYILNSQPFFFQNVSFEQHF